MMYWVTNQKAPVAGKIWCKLLGPVTLFCEVESDPNGGRSLLSSLMTLGKVWPKERSSTIARNGQKDRVDSQEIPSQYVELLDQDIRRPRGCPKKSAGLQFYFMYGIIFLGGVYENTDTSSPWSS